MYFVNQKQVKLSLIKNIKYHIISSAKVIKIMWMHSVLNYSFQIYLNVHYRWKVWGHPDNFMFSMKTQHLFIKWVAKWIENIVKTLTRLEIMIWMIIWNNNFVLQTLLPVVGGNWLQSGYGMVLQNGAIAFLIQNPFYLVQISHFTSTKAAPDHHLTSTMLDRWCQALLQHLFTCSASHKCSSVWSKHLKLFLSVLFSNLPLSNVCVLLPILIFSFYWPVSDMAFSLPLCLEGQHPGVASSLWMLRLAFCGYHLMKLPVEDLWGVYFSN